MFPYNRLVLRKMKIVYKSGRQYILHLFCQWVHEKTVLAVLILGRIGSVEKERYREKAEVIR